MSNGVEGYRSMPRRPRPNQTESSIEDSTLEKNTSDFSDNELQELNSEFPSLGNICSQIVDYIGEKYKYDSNQQELIKKLNAFARNSGSEKPASELVKDFAKHSRGEIKVTQVGDTPETKLIIGELFHITRKVVAEKKAISSQSE